MTMPYKLKFSFIYPSVTHFCNNAASYEDEDEDEDDNDDDTGKDYWRSDFLRHVIEKVSLMSNSWGIPSSPDGSSQSKL
ncbi:hypothetical protein C4D60_Mb06t31450 [Musa balbisiana]|uniref:Uncharacterized protein n=1 Tax=Musa balbisiana TaxID=52838 RepID=A0A4S8IS05_MUSBA|nr:hypothetical protein C4D60_Mb06t31450 [Musa balbisiana]